MNNGRYLVEGHALDSAKDGAGYPHHANLAELPGAHLTAQKLDRFLGMAAVQGGVTAFGRNMRT